MSSPSPKRIKLEASSSPSFEPALRDDLDIDAFEDPETEQCSICLQPIADRTLIPSCSHEFCFECLHVWTDQSRRCPLCSQGIGDYLIHHIRSKYDFQKHYLTPLRTSPNSQPLLPATSGSRGRNSGSGREVQWGRTNRRARQRERDAADALERAIDKRRWVYRHGLYAKHVASNFYTRYRPFPTPSQFATNPDLITRATIFIRRELHVWGCLDVEFLTTFIISLLKSLDVRSESAIKLLSEFLDLDSEHELQVRNNNKRPRANAEHFAHELYCYLRSPYRDLSVYDTVVQYDIPEDYSPRPTTRSRRWRSRSASSSRQQPPSRSRSHSPSKPGSSESSNRQTSSRHKQARRGRVSPSHSVSPRDERHRYSSSEPHLAKEAGESGRDEAGEGTISRDRKGKGRAVHDSDVFESSDYRRSVEEDGILTPHGVGASSAVQSSALRIEQNPIRNETSLPTRVTEGGSISTAIDASHVSISRRPRSVFDQLQSHLSKASDIKKAILQGQQLPIGNEGPEKHLDESFQHPVATKPSLLDRLSSSLAPIQSREDGGSRDTSHDQDGVDRIMAPDHMDIIHGSRTTTTPALNKVVHATGQVSKTTRETMLQWLNVANQSGNRDLKPKQRFNGIDGVSATVKSPTLTSPPSSPSTTSASSLQRSADSTQASSCTLRARLLTKLENERRVRDGTVSASAAPVTNNGATPPHPGDKIHSSNSSSSHSDSALEAKLRSQALLRARLAVEKKKIDNPGNQSQACADEDEGKRSSLESSERELRLKIQLRKARG